jgi:mRNA interferase MazF
MISAGQVVLFKFPQTDQKEVKLRPALVLRKLPGIFNDWLVCMISSQLHQYLPGIDEKISYEDHDFLKSVLKLPSIVRVSRLAVLDGKLLLGELGRIDDARFIRLKQNLCKWIEGE